MRDLTDQEWRYYVSARAVTVWDRRSKQFGTFDSRTFSVKEDFELKWANGKVNQIKNSLLRKGLFKKILGKHRLSIVNAEIFLGKGRKYESLIRDAETNLQRDENYVQRTESQAALIRVASRSIAEEKRALTRPEIQSNESGATCKE